MHLKSLVVFFTLYLERICFQIYLTKLPGKYILESPTPPILTPGDGTPPVERRRHNSAPDESKEVAKVQENLLNLDALARTRSSTSLQDMNDNLSPCLSATELDADGKV